MERQFVKQIAYFIKRLKIGARINGKSLIVYEKSEEDEQIQIPTFKSMIHLTKDHVAICQPDLSKVEFIHVNILEEEKTELGRKCLHPPHLLYFKKKGESLNNRDKIESIMKMNSLLNDFIPQFTYLSQPFYGLFLTDDMLNPVHPKSKNWVTYTRTKILNRVFGNQARTYLNKQLHRIYNSVIEKRRKNEPLGNDSDYDRLFILSLFTLTTVEKKHLGIDNPKSQRVLKLFRRIINKSI